MDKDTKQLIGGFSGLITYVMCFSFISLFIIRGVDVFKYISFFILLIIVGSLGLLVLMLSYRSMVMEHKQL